MDSQDSKINILIVGATGNLGTIITKNCLATPNLLVNILVRDPQKNKELVEQVEKAGGKVIKGDVNKPETLKDITKGMHTVIFSLSVDEKATLNGQIEVIKDCIANGVKRVVPTEYTENFLTVSREEAQLLPPFEWKFKIRDYLKTLPIKTLYVNTGLFMDTFYPNVMTKDYECWGDPNHKFQLTSYDDTAKVIAAAVSRPEKEGEVVFVSDEVTAEEAAEIYNKVRGANLVANRKGSVEDLRALATEHEKVDKSPFSWFPRWKSFIFEGRSRFEKLNNVEFPEIKSVVLEDFLKQNPHVTA